MERAGFNRSVAVTGEPCSHENPITLGAIGSVVEHAVGRQIDDEAAHSDCYATIWMPRMVQGFQPDGLVAGKVAR